MTDKIKLKADKFVNDKKLKLNYIKTKDLKILLAEFCEEQIVELEKENAELKEALKGKVCNCMTYLNFKDLEKECAKAKDILQRLMENQPTPSSMYEEIDLVGWREVNKEAKQFLKEIK